MESDFVTRQHIESLTPDSDPDMAELMNKYKFPPINPQLPPQQSQNFAPFPLVVPQPHSNDAILIGNMLGQIQGNLQNKSQFGNFQMSNTIIVLIGFLILFFLAVIVWLIVRQKKEKPLQRRLKKIEKEMKRLKRLRKNPSKKIKSLPKTDEEDELDNDNDID